MTIAPNNILRAANETIAWGCIYIRNQTLTAETPNKMINNMMEAIHDIPHKLMNWDTASLNSLRIDFGCFPSDAWEGSPDLVKFFDQRLEEYSQ